jgi:hypothetical protein
MAELKNPFLSIAFDTRAGQFSLCRHDGSVLVRGATIRANTSEARHSIAADYSHAAESTKIADKLGKGRQLIVRSKDLAGKLDFESRLALYDHRPCMIIEAHCTNVSRQDVRVTGIEPICCLAEHGSALRWPGASAVLTNGPMYYDAGTMRTFGTPHPAPGAYGSIKGCAPSPDIGSPAGQQVHSWWNVGLFRGYSEEGLVCGFVENTVGLGQIIVSKTNPEEVSLYAEAVFSPTTRLEPGQSISTGRFVITIAPTPYAALEDFASIMGTLARARCHSIVNGWCSWFFTYEFITEAEVLRNAEFAARWLKPYGLQYIQIDEGYQRQHGDWQANERFPHGMRWLAERIKTLGFKPGLWIAPYVIAEPTRVYREHPDWLLAGADGHPLRVGPWPTEDSPWAHHEHPKRYGLDITHPGAADWLFALFDTAANTWGYEMFKIDFVAWSLLSAHRYHNPAVTPAQAYRQGMQIIRSAIGPERHINDCGPGPVSVGLIDSMRIECDQNYGYGPTAWKHYFTESSSSAAAAAKRYFFHKRTWINDVDHVCTSLLTVPQAQAVASLIAMSGGNAISGDRLPDLDPTRLEILKKILPAVGVAARPVDLFDSDRQSVFALRIEKPFGAWTIVCLVNTNASRPVVRSFPLERLWLDPKKRYIAYDFWMERLWGEVTGTLELSVAPASVTLLALHRKSGVPQVVSTDRHVLQGAIELEHTAWDAATRTLSGISTGPLASSHRVSVYLPEGTPWTQDRRQLYHDFEGYTVKLVDDHLLRVHVRFERCQRVTWSVAFDTLFAVS